MEKKLIRLILLFFVLFIAFCRPIFADSISKVQVVEEEFSKDYKNWLNMKEEEKENLIEPDPYGTPYYSNNSNKKLPLGMVDIGKVYASSFDLRDFINLNVKNQMSTGMCWTLATTTVLESNISLTTKRLSPIFSGRHMEYATSKTFLDGINKNGYDREVNTGGNNFYSLSYCTSGFGPVLEEKMPFVNTNEQIYLSEIDKDSLKKVEEYVRFPSIYKKYENGNIKYMDNVNNTLTNVQVESIREQIKNHISSYRRSNSNFIYVR